MPDVKFGGETFRTADQVAYIAVLKFAHLAKSGLDTSDLDGLSAMYDLLEQCLHEDDWQRFQTAALRTKASGDELLNFVADVGKALRGSRAEPTVEPAKQDGAFDLFPA
jgi:hypothetical protein